MVSFGKGKDDKAVKKHRYRYDLSSGADEGIADVLLTEKNAHEAAPLAAALVESDASKEDELIYELVVEEKSTAPNESAAPGNLNQQVEKLCHEYAAINQQLEKSLAASDDLTKQLEKSKKVVTASYVAIGVGGLAFLAGVGAIVVGINLQRDLTDLRNTTTSLTEQVAATKKETALKNKEIDERIVQLNDKVDKIFAVGNLDNVLQVTRELRKQVHALASKNLAMMNNRNQLGTEAVKPNKISLPSLKLEAAEKLQTDKPSVSNQAVDKSETIAKVETTKKTQDAKPESINNSTNDDGAAKWLVTFDTFKDKTLAKEAANKFKKAGVGVEIIQIKGKKHSRYRVVSKTFKNKQEAQDHAEQMKKTLGIHSAVLTKTK